VLLGKPQFNCRLARSAKGRKKSLHWYISSEQLNKEKIAMLLKGVGDCQEQTQVRMRYSMPDFPHFSAARFPRPPCVETGFRERN